MSNVVTVQGITVVLSHVCCVSTIETVGLASLWSIQFDGGGLSTTFRFKTTEDAKRERDDFIQMLTDYWRVQWR